MYGETFYFVASIYVLHGKNAEVSVKFRAITVVFIVCCCNPLQFWQYNQRLQGTGVVVVVYCAVLSLGVAQYF